MLLFLCCHLIFSLILFPSSNAFFSPVCTPFLVVIQPFWFRYKEDGHCKGAPEFEPPAPIRLKWEIPLACIDQIENSYQVRLCHCQNRNLDYWCFGFVQVSLSLLNDVDLRLYVHSAFGKGLMKKCRLSPDAFIQMALQLAYYRVSTSMWHWNSPFFS